MTYPMPTGHVFCVSIHDVSVFTWEACEQLINLPFLKNLPLTLLLVPDWHRQDDGKGPSAQAFVDCITAMHEQEHELCLHGYTHLDEQPVPLSDCWRRRVLTRSEGEFSALDESLALQRLHRGQRWLSAHRWVAKGFVPPAWMINAQGISAVRRAGFEYLGLYRRWIRLADGKSLIAPTITYSTRLPAGDALWRDIQRTIYLRESRWPVLRLALHPADLGRSANLDHASRQVARWLRYREPKTEYQAYRSLAGARAVVQQEKIKRG
jgi:predicted deacetylase